MRATPCIQSLQDVPLCDDDERRANTFCHTPRATKKTKNKARFCGNGMEWDSVGGIVDLSVYLYRLYSALSSAAMNSVIYMWVTCRYGGGL